jgi:excisionase family DNA binding protein
MSKDIQTETWVSLPEAARQLGVHSSTLRRWADNGDIPFMRTPGGHRRFVLRDIERFANENRQMESTAVALTWAREAMDQTKYEISHPENKPWLTAVTEQSRGQHRLLGQRLMGLTLQYVSAVTNHEKLLEEARQVGVAYGRLAQMDQMSLPEVLQATLFFRDMLVETALNLSPTAGVRPEDNLRLTRRINQIMNAVHLSIASVYEQ